MNHFFHIKRVDIYRNKIDNMKNDIYENALRNGDFELLKKN